jgi:hypothetical protein
LQEPISNSFQNSLKLFRVCKESFNLMTLQGIEDGLTEAEIKEKGRRKLGF